ncbi:unnamed protein product [Timema podura]|uniref:WD repeat-containing protein 89 n=1 Tax=Timema podura TaxID=61482 RepID=A0ABN7NM53_TIMPD|nr:unnamed protein product [Timema podura]
MQPLKQVRFHPSKCDTIATGSTDGLINIFDLSQGCEDDALLYSLNTEASVRKSVEDCYLVNLHQNTSSRELFLIAGTTAQRGECLRTVAVKNNTLKPLSQFLENKQIVRTSWYDENNGMLVTGGESGLISLWKPSKSTLESSSSGRKHLVLLPNQL